MSRSAPLRAGPLRERSATPARCAFGIATTAGPKPCPPTPSWSRSFGRAVRAAPAEERTAKIEAEIADLERRLTRQLVDLEADDVTAALRRCVGQRVAELEDAVAERRERLVALARESATEAPTSPDVAALLDRLPILTTSLDAAPQGEMRALFDALQLDVAHQRAEAAVDVTVTLYDRGDRAAQTAAQVRAED